MSQNPVMNDVGGRVDAGPPPVVHLELHTPDLSGARDFYARLLQWRVARIDTEHGHYHALGLGGEITGGVVECATDRPMWLPYAQVDSIGGFTDRARQLGASVLLGPREGPAGWRSIISAPGAGEVALWQPKAWR